MIIHLIVELDATAIKELLDCISLRDANFLLVTGKYSKCGSVIYRWFPYQPRRSLGWLSRLVIYLFPRSIRKKTLYKLAGYASRSLEIKSVVVPDKMFTVNRVQPRRERAERLESN